MKKIILSLLVLMNLVVFLTACGKSEDTTSTEEAGYKIGLVQLMEHQALDNTREGFIEELDSLALDYSLDYQNAQGDIGVARTIVEKFVSDDVDLIFAIATPAAEAALAATSDIPILFSAVTDPVKSHLVDSMEAPGGNVSGTSDAANVSDQLQMFSKLDSSIKKIGVLYSLDEINSQIQVEEVEKAGQEVGLEVVSKGISNISDLPQVAASLIKEVDGLYLVSDNKIAASVALVADLLVENKMISICADESQVAGGALLTRGLSYKELGKQTGQMAKRVLVDGENISQIPVEKASKLDLYVNEKTLEALGLSKDLEILQDAIYIGD